MPAPRTLLIAYDIASPSIARPALIEAIMTLGEAWARPLETVWYLRTHRPADEVEACLAPLVGETDGLMVQETRGDACLVNTGLRWFRPRRQAESARPGIEERAAPSGAVLPFSRQTDHVQDLDRAA